MALTNQQFLVVACALLLTHMAAAQIDNGGIPQAASPGVRMSVPASGLCNTGLTPASPLPAGCSTSTPVTPVNPSSGGRSVDGNWQLATPYPSPYNDVGPDPCSLTFGPAWVDTPAPGWFNPSDGLSQWISPEVDAPNTVGGWYIYRTAFPVPAASGTAKYRLAVTGKFLADDVATAVLLSNPGGNRRGCGVVALTPLMPSPAPYLSNQDAWTGFRFAATVAPNTTAYLYFVVYNIETTGSVNYTGFRAEFTSASFTAE